jgi:hypothetical protein
MPLMRDWSDALVQALEDEEERLSEACHLQEGMSPEEFEQNLGLLVRWDQVRHLQDRFKVLSGPQPMSFNQYQTEAIENSDRRMKTVMATINATLHDQFGLGRVDNELAASAYRALLRHFKNPALVVATTNYDRSAEAALSEIGHNVDTGFRSAPERTPRLRPTGMVSDQPVGIPVLHLHGAVGWYERDGNVENHFGDQPYNPSLGVPAVLYPDPDKDPTSSAYVSLLWSEFRTALDGADVVLVIGHSLNDRPLVGELREIARKKRVGITYCADQDAEAVTSRVADALPIQMDFGAKIEVDGKALKQLTT